MWSNRKRNFLQTKYQLVNKQTNRIWNFLQTGFQLFNMLNAAHNSKEKLSSYMAYLLHIYRLLMAIYAYKWPIYAHNWSTKGLTFSEPNISCSTNKQTGNGSFSKLVFSCSTCSMPHTILRRGLLHLSLKTKKLKRELSPNWFSAVQHAQCRTQF